MAKIDQATRVVTLKAADGKEYSFVADEAVKILAQVKKGDTVTASYSEALAYQLKKGGSASGAVVTAASGSAKTRVDRTHHAWRLIALTGAAS